ncbi:MAG: nucleotidyltransferase family protein [Bacteroidales bacterium]|nr:nucleotidyltransferase family protein [Bacteroidales bacterium]
MISPENLDQLKELTLKHTFKSLHLVNELLGLCKKFNEAGIGYVVIKGPQLSHFLYGDATARVSVDLDIFLEDHRFFFKGC